LLLLLLLSFPRALSSHADASPWQRDLSSLGVGEVQELEADLWLMSPPCQVPSSEAPLVAISSGAYSLSDTRCFFFIISPTPVMESKLAPMTPEQRALPIW